MADTIKSSNDLSIGLDYMEENAETGITSAKTIYLKVPNPKVNLTENEIRTATQTFIEQNIIKDPTGTPFSASAIGTAYTTKETKIDIDLN